MSEHRYEKRENYGVRDEQQNAQKTISGQKELVE